MLNDDFGYIQVSKMCIRDRAIRITAERNPADLKCNEVGAEYVVESTGLFLSKDKAQAHIGVSSLEGADITTYFAPASM